ncbi:MAG: addiction module protein [Actinomycetota bacterium]
MPYDAVTECQAQTLLTEALALSEDDRAGLAAELLARLDEPSSATQAEIDRSWAAEIERRSARFRSGETAGVPWDQVRSKVERRLAAG